MKTNIYHSKEAKQQPIQQTKGTYKPCSNSCDVIQKMAKSSYLLNQRDILQLQNTIGNSATYKFLSKENQTDLSKSRNDEVVQGKFAMKFKILANNSMNMEYKGIAYAGNNWTLQIDEQQKLHFVIEDITTENELISALFQMQNLIYDMKENCFLKDDMYIFLPTKKGKWHIGQDVPIIINDFTFETSIDATEEIPLSKIPELITTYMGKDTLFLDYMNEFGIRKKTSPKVQGLISMIMVYIYTLKNIPKNSKRELKEHFILVAQTSFKDMHDLLDDKEKKEFYSAIGLKTDRLSRNNWITKQFGIQREDVLYGREENGNDKYPVGPTLQDWILSIRDGGANLKKNADLMSPPIGTEFVWNDYLEKHPHSNFSLKSIVLPENKGKAKLTICDNGNLYGTHFFNSNLMQEAQTFYQNAMTRDPEELKGASSTQMNYNSWFSKWKVFNDFVMGFKKDILSIGAIYELILDELNQILAQYSDKMEDKGVNKFVIIQITSCINKQAPHIRKMLEAVFDTISKEKQNIFGTIYKNTQSGLKNEMAKVNTYFKKIEKNIFDIQNESSAMQNEKSMYIFRGPDFKKITNMLYNGTELLDNIYITLFGNILNLIWQDIRECWDSEESETTCPVSSMFDKLGYEQEDTKFMGHIKDENDLKKYQISKMEQQEETIKTLKDIQDNHDYLGVRLKPSSTYKFIGGTTDTE